jgi:hypothetical protein
MTAVSQDIGTDKKKPYIAGDDLDINARAVEPKAVATDPDVPIDLTDATSIRYEVFPWPQYDPKRESEPETTPVVVKALGENITITDAEDGRLKISIVGEDDTATLSGNFFHEAQAVIGGKTRTLFRGRFFITWQRVV